MFLLIGNNGLSNVARLMMISPVLLFFTGYSAVTKTLYPRRRFENVGEFGLLSARSSTSVGNLATLDVSNCMVITRCELSRSNFSETTLPNKGRPVPSPKTPLCPPVSLTLVKLIEVTFPPLGRPDNVKKNGLFLPM